MGFEHLIEKVTQAEQALESHERAAAADWRQFKRSWKQSWTPGRVVIAGLASGFVVGKVQVPHAVSGHGVLNLLSALSGVMASGSAQKAAGEAAQAQVRANPADAFPASAAEAPRPLQAAAGTRDGDLAAERRYEDMRSSGLL